MRPSRARALSGMLLRYFGRRVLRSGVLASRPLRLAAALLVAGLAVVAVVAAVTFLEPLRSEPEAWDLLFDATSISAVLWCLVAVLLTKTLFLNAEGMLALTFALPVTNRERAAAFVLFEAATAGIVVAAGVGAMAVAALVLRGPSALLPLVESIVLPVLLTYLVVGLAYQLLTWVLTAVGLRRTQPPVLLLSLFALLIAYAATVPRLTAAVSGSYLEGTDERPWTAGVASLADQWGHPAALATCAAAMAVLAVATVALAPNRHLTASRYLPWRAGALTRRLLGPYDWCVFRSLQTWLPTVLAAAVYVALTIKPLAHPMWALSLVSMGALYQFAATEPLRRLRGGRTPAWSVYVRLLRAQALLWLLLAVPATAAVLVVEPGAVADVVDPLVGSLAGTVLALAVGIVFPAVDDNPFSLFVGLSLAVVVVTALALAIGVLSLPPPVAAALAVATLALAVVYSVVGITTHESRRRHEEVADRRQQRGRGGAADPRRRRRDPAGAHVLDGR
ncbi:hypothetical protein [Aeromicrobium sp. Leaf350]|uniref:hypothetical protein n=1 Tax=Aeromicrobium sp. Leaf350 TaxID=2876565 RepID=UPI001E419494|nr:hypothetical protein [Aeromicrobium sp. Leaf350]